MKIAHISDLHYGDNRVDVEGLTQRIINTYKSDQQKPLIIISGDLIHTPLIAYMEKCKNLLQNLKNEGFEMLICHGNHDFKENGVFKVDNGLDNFNKHFKDLIARGNLNGDDKNDFYSYPIVHQFDKYAFIGLNSNEKPHYFTANGEFKKAQLNKAIQFSKDFKSKNENAVIVAYFHHDPFKFNFRFPVMKLIKRKRFQELFKNHFDVFLFGHYHFDIPYDSKAKELGIKLAISAGGSTYNEKNFMK